MNKFLPRLIKRHKSFYQIDQQTVSHAERIQELPGEEWGDQNLYIVKNCSMFISSRQVPEINENMFIYTSR